MRRYRGVDKAPGPSISPPPNRNRMSTGGDFLQLSVNSFSKPATSMENSPLMITGSGTNNNLYLDPRTKQPAMPAAGRSIPKLKLSDLTSSISPLMDSGLSKAPKVPMTKTDKRIAATMKEITAAPAKDMLESFDEALRSPDMKAISTRVSQLKKGVGVPSQIAKFSTRSPNPPPVNGLRKKSSGKLAGKTEEQNIRLLMNQLKDKYLDDMESQLGLAVERRPRAAMGSMMSTGVDPSGGDGPVDFGVPRPSTNVTEVTARIDKVVRDWAAESQKMQKMSANPSSTVSRQASASKQKEVALRKADLGSGSGSSAKRENENEQSKKSSPASKSATPAENKNLAKISTAFRKSLDPISKRDVNMLINIPEEDHIEKLQEEHDERRRAHQSVFKNANILDGAPPSSAKPNKEAGGGSRAQSSKQEAADARQKVINNATASPGKLERKPFVESLKSAQEDENEMYTIIKDHMEYEMGGGRPKLTLPRKPSYTKVPQKSSRTSLLRSDAAGKALLKYNDSHRKLQSLVDNFQEKVAEGEGPAMKRPGPLAPPMTAPRGENSLSDVSDVDEDKSRSLFPGQNSTNVPSVTMLSPRKQAPFDVTATLSKSMKTIDRASNVAQRLGTLMSRVSLRNQKYDYEKQVESDAKMAVTTSTDTADLLDSSTPNISRKPSSSLQIVSRRQSSSLNPYETIDSNANSVESGPNVHTGVTNLASDQFSKYVEEMKKVAEKAAQSFEKFKERQLASSDNNNELLSSDEEPSNTEVDLTPFQQQQQPPQQQQRQRQLITKTKTKLVSARKTAPPPTLRMKSVDTGTSPREPAAAAASSSAQPKVDPIKLNEENGNADFKFVPDMSYTDQLMLQKLRKLKEKEGWGDTMQSQVDELSQAEGWGDLLSGEGAADSAPNDKEKVESLLKRAAPLEVTGPLEKPGMGAALSLNQILRARMNSK